MPTVPELIDGIIKRESPLYTNDPKDAGGPTKFGITQKTLARVRGHAVTPADVSNLTREEAAKIYEAVYIKEPGFNQITNGQLYTALIDFGVTSGPERSIKTLQKVLGVKVDGELGPVTAAAVNAKDGRTLCNAFSCERAAFYADLAQNHANDVKYVEGWVRRALIFVV